MAAVASAVPQRMLAPLPQTERGWGIHVDISKKDHRLIYCNANVVVLRSLENPAECDIFYEHKTRVTTARFSPNGEWVASGDDKGRVMIWGSKNKIVKNTYQLLKKINDICWSDDGQRLIVGGDGSEAFAKVIAWDTGNTLGDVHGQSKQVLSVAFKPNRPYKVVATSEDNLVNFYTGPPFKFDHSFSEHTRYPNCVRYSSDGAHFITVGSDSKIFMFDGTTGQKVKEFEAKDAHTGSIYSLSWSPDNKHILTASGDKTAKLWNVASGECEKTFTFGANVGDMQVATAWDATHMVTVSLSGAINILDPDNTNKPKLVFHGHQSAIRAYDFDAKNKLFLTGDADGQITRWDLDSGLGTWIEGKAHGGKGITAIAINADASAWYSCGLDDKVRMNDAKSNEFTGDLVAVGGLPTGVAASRKDPNLAVVSVSQGKLHVLRAGKIASSVDVKYRPNTIAISPDDTEVAVGGDDKKVHVFSLDGDALKETKTFSAQGSVDAVAFSPNNLYLTVGDRIKYVFNWLRTADAETEAINSWGWTNHTSKITHVAWNAGGERVASSSQDQHIYVWVMDEKCLGDNKMKLEFAHAEGALFSAFVNDNTLVSIGNDRTIKFWQV